MKLLNLEQGSHDWLEWRKLGIGASDACHLLGNAPWNSPDELRAIKLGRKGDKPDNPAMARGRRLEPEARAGFNDLTGLSMVPACVIHATYPWCRASLDGITADHRFILEIKCMGKEKHKKALERREYPDYYLPQLQHQLACVDTAEHGFFLSYHPDFKGLDRYVVLPFYHDREYQKRLLETEQRFWESLSMLQ